MFVVHDGSPVHADRRKKDILILRKGPTDILYDTTITAEVKYSISSTERQNKFCLSQSYNGSNRF